MKPSVSVIVPAFNEAGNIVGTITAIVDGLAAAGLADYEIIIFDDCSTDGTGSIADGLAKRNASIRVVHNKPNKGFGYNFQKGIELATKKFIGLIPGDNEVREESLAALFRAIGDTDIVSAYHATMEVRPPMRRIISRTFTFLMNALFGLRMRYFNGPAFIRADLLRAVPRSSMGFGFFMEILVQLLRAGATCTEVGMKIRPRAYGTPTAFKLKNIARVLGTIATVWRRVYCTDGIAKLRALRLSVSARGEDLSPYNF